MAAEARREARRKRILENSNERLQRIIKSQTSPSKKDRESAVSRSIEFQMKDESDNSENSLKHPTFRVGVTENGVKKNLTSSSKDPRIEETRNFGEQNDLRTNKLTQIKTSVTTGVQESLLGRWARFGLNVLLAAFLVVCSKREDNGILEYFFGPWIGLQIFMFSIPPLRQETSSSWLSVFKVALQLSGIPAYYTSTLDTIYSYFVLMLLDLPVFVFSTVITVEFSILISGLEYI